MSKRVRTVRALRLDAFSPRAVLTALGGRFRPELYRGGAGSVLKLVEMPAPTRPPGWVRIRPVLAGICASDRKMLHLHPTDVSGFGRTVLAVMGMPRSVVLGHEVVGVVTEADPGAGIAEGDRVVAEPLLSCEDKGFPACGRCARGDDHICERRPAAGHLSPGNGFGHEARYGGGWSDELVAPAHRVFRVPEDLDDRAAVLAEPTAVSVHAVLRNLPEAGQRALVIGPGAIGLAALRALRTLAPDVHLTVAGLDPASDRHAVEAGAHDLIHGTRRTLVEAAATITGSTVHGNRLTGPVLESGFDVVYDAVGSPQTVDDAFRMTRPGGTVVMLATAARQPLDWTLVWIRELRLQGAAYYATEEVPPTARLPAGRRRAMEVALELLADQRPGHLVTHTFPLEDPVAALEAAAAGPAVGAVKVAFDVGATPA